MDGEQISIQPEIWLDNEDEKVLKNNANEVWVVGEVGLEPTKERKPADFQSAAFHCFHCKKWLYVAPMSHCRGTAPTAMAHLRQW